MYNGLMRFHNIPGVDGACCEVPPTNNGIRVTRPFMREAYYNKACCIAEGALDALSRGDIASAHRQSLRLNRILASLGTAP